MAIPAGIKKYFTEITLLPTWWPRFGGILRAARPWTTWLPSDLLNMATETASNSDTQGQKESRISLSRKQKIFFLDMIGSLVEAGIPLVKSLQLLYFQSKEPPIKEVCLYLKTRIEQWKNLWPTSRELGRVFWGFDSAMFDMGEATGKMGYVFGKLTAKEEKLLEIERKVLGALMYPMAVVGVAVLMMTGLLVFIVPRIEKIYLDAHTALPPLTKAVINASHFLQSYGILLAGLLVLIGLGLKLMLRKPAVRLAFDQSVLNLPIFGRLIQFRTLVSFCDFLSLLLSSGITIHKALEIVSSGLPNTYFRAHTRGIIGDIRTGKHLSDAIGGEYLEKRMSGEDASTPELLANKARLDLFTVELSTSVKVGEQTGSLASMLEKAGKRYEKEIDVTVKNLNSLLEPIVIIVIGAWVGVIILAIMLPFFNMAKVIG